MERRGEDGGAWLGARDTGAAGEHNNRLHDGAQDVLRAGALDVVAVAVVVLINSCMALGRAGRDRLIDTEERDWVRRWWLILAVGLDF